MILSILLTALLGFAQDAPAAVKKRRPNFDIEPQSRASLLASRGRRLKAHRAQHSSGRQSIANRGQQETPEDVVQDSGDTPQEQASGATGLCRADGKTSIDPYQVVLDIVKNGVMPARGGFDLNAPSWPSLVSAGGGKLKVTFPGKQSMCTSATATAFYSHIAAFVNAGQLKLNVAQVNYLNKSKQVKNALNGNTFSLGVLFDYLGGETIAGWGNAKAREILKQAKPGDYLKFDRKSGGHSTIFKGIKGNQFCYWSSNRKTKGAGEQCEPLSRLVTASVTRFPSNLAAMPGKIDKMIEESRNPSSRLVRRFKSSKSRHDVADIKSRTQFSAAQTMVACNGTPGASPETAVASR